MSEDTIIGGTTPPPNAANPAQVKAATKQREWKDDEQANDLRAILQTPEGKRFLLRLLDETRVMLDPFNRDVAQMAHDIGVQEMGRTLIAWLGKADPAAFPRLLLVQLEQKRQEAIERARLIDKESPK